MDITPAQRMVLDREKKRKEITKEFLGDDPLRRVEEAILDAYEAGYNKGFKDGCIQTTN